jgi:membrane-associated protease RseP (regulator of RpoE activity)
MKRLTLLSASLTLSASLAVLAAASPLAAQRVTVRDGRPLARGEGYTYSFSNRAVIGVTLDMRPSGGDSLGATLSAVTPGGPAATAGLLAGDIITRFNGTALVERTRAGDRDEETEQSRPAMKLLELTSQMSV